MAARQAFHHVPCCQAVVVKLVKGCEHARSMSRMFMGCSTRTKLSARAEPNIAFGSGCRHQLLPWVGVCHPQPCALNIVYVRTLGVPVHWQCPWLSMSLPSRTRRTDTYATKMIPEFPRATHCNLDSESYRARVHLQLTCKHLECKQYASRQDRASMHCWCTLCRCWQGRQRDDRQPLRCG